MSKDRVLRGGSFNNGTWNLRTIVRYGREPEDRYRNDGFRLVLIRRKR